MELRVAFEEEALSGDSIRVDLTMNDRSRRLPVSDQFRKGLEEERLHVTGELRLKTTTLETPHRPPEVAARELTKLRLDAGMSQAVFAQVLNVSTKTVQSWEQGARKPSQAALRLIQVFRENPAVVLQTVGMSGAITNSVGRARAGRKPVAT